MKWTLYNPFITELCRISQKFGNIGNYSYLCG